MYEHVYTSMATKTISITREAYDRLKARKGPEESFSDVILRLTDRRPLAESAGMLSKTSVRAMRKQLTKGGETDAHWKSGHDRGFRDLGWGPPAPGNFSESLTSRSAPHGRSPPPTAVDAGMPGSPPRAARSHPRHGTHSRSPSP